MIQPKNNSNRPSYETAGRNIERVKQVNPTNKRAAGNSSNGKNANSLLDKDKLHSFGKMACKVAKKILRGLLEAFKDAWRIAWNIIKLLFKAIGKLVADANARAQAQAYSQKCNWLYNNWYYRVAEDLTEAINKTWLLTMIQPSKSPEEICIGRNGTPCPVYIKDGHIYFRYYGSLRPVTPNIDVPLPRRKSILDKELARICGLKYSYEPWTVDLTVDPDDSHVIFEVEVKIP